MHKNAMLMKTLPFALLYVVGSVAGLLLIKAAGNTGLSLFGLRLNWKVLFGLLVYFLGFCNYLFLVQHYNLSFVFPMVIGLNYVVVVAVSALFLGEAINLTQWMGIVAILGGIVLMNLKQGGT